MIYHKHYIPLESNPILFTQLIHHLGVSPSLAFHDVLSIDDPELLAFIPRPALALILVFPTSPSYEAFKAEEEAVREEYDGSGKNEAVMWYKQTINNACGLYAILHAVSNEDSRKFILPNSHLPHLIESCQALKPIARAQLLEDDAELESAYKLVALQGDSEVPANPEDEVDFHYVCFVKSHQDGHLYELDGDRRGPVDRGLLAADADVLAERSLNLIREFIQREDNGLSAGFSLLVLAPAL